MKAINTAIKKTSGIAIPALALFIPAFTANAAVTYGTAGFEYEQNFNSLARGTNPDNTTYAWSNDSTIEGWYWVNASTGTTPSTYKSRKGDVAPGEVLSLGSIGSTDRALGAQNNNNVQTLSYGVQFLNTTGATLSSFMLAYTGEQWRVIGNEDRDGLTFEYQVFNAGAGSLTAAGGWTNVAALNFAAPRTTTGSSTALDGNLDVNRVVFGDTEVTGLTWNNGQELWLRWSDNNPVNDATSPAGSTSRRAQMGIDDITFSAIPEPSSALLGAVGFLALLRRRR